ncbi:c-type cytochrome [Methyloversatilis thermotolerans]|uniref:c-type cytochrome n=1 Tax=Methyloversatilis thermotolerans TaxID=1346290 RepID=UPI000377C61A|nr:c-type cytochrome [Methyloversatilis thermotolerans]
MKDLPLRRMVACSLFSVLLPAIAHADPAAVERGREVFKLCAGCHSVDKDVTLFGPSLHGIANRPAGRLKGYEYSDALAAARFRWDAKNLTRWLEDEPKNMVEGTRMEFPGITDRKALADLVAYLMSLKGR